MTRLTRVIVITLVATTAAGIGAADVRAQVRDVSPVAAPRGTGELGGQVISTAEPRQPVRRAIVTISGGGMPHGRSTVTDDEGRFVVRALPQGRYVVTATKAGYLTATYGARLPGRSGVPIQLGEGETRHDLSIVMAKGAVVAGMLRTDTGEPATGIDVGVFRLPAAGQNLHLAPAGAATSDDRGMYRVYGLPPGDYVVAASLRRVLPGNGDADAWTPEQVDRTLAHLQNKTATPPGEPEGRFNWAPIYFPGVASPAEAVPIRLRAGDEREGIDLTVSMVRMASVEGVLLGDPDVVGRAQFFFNALGTRLEPLLGVTPVFTTSTTPAGKVFAYTGVAPGLYSVTAHLPGSDGAWAKVEFHVDGRDVRDLTLTLQPTLRLSGRVEFDGLEHPPADLLRGATIRPVPSNGIGQAAAGSTRMGNPFVPAVPVNSAGRFEIAGVVPETVTLNVTAPSAAGWFTQSVLVNGVDVLDQPLTLVRDEPDIVVTMSRRATQLSGRITAEGGLPGTALFIAVFPEDRAWWRPQSRRVASARADTDGRWVIDGLPAGDYFVAALTDVGPDELTDAEFLSQLIPAAVRVSLAAGEHKVQDLRVGRGGGDR